VANTLAKLVQELEEKNLQVENVIGIGEPLFNLAEPDGTKIPVHSLMDLLDRIRELGRKGLSIQRYKGLGEMNPEQLWETTLDPANRKLLQVILQDAVKTDDIFTVLMGDEVPPRRSFIEDHALSVQNLDI
jgi:DNA gyrase subunit B